ncbi:unnamed protein product [Lathyrus oleraceus]|uniref:PLAT domain-containing protein n=1 Tax=Pisum sativum TaxID=3888 RepID=A0A9D5AUM8_PEA|nr:hypothetical protein KIW84_045827 [Pisum sativum]
MISIARGRFNRSQKVKGTVVLMHKNVLDINALTSLIKSGFKVANSIAGSICDTCTSTLGFSVALRLISATNADESGKGKVGKRTFLEGIVTSIPILGAGQCAFNVHFKWDSEMVLENWV